MIEIFTDVHKTWTITEKHPAGITDVHKARTITEKT